MKKHEEVQNMNNFGIGNYERLRKSGFVHVNSCKYLLIGARDFNCWQVCKREDFVKTDHSHVEKPGALPVMSFLTCTDSGIVRNHIGW